MKLGNTTSLFITQFEWPKVLLSIAALKLSQPSAGVRIKIINCTQRVTYTHARLIEKVVLTAFEAEDRRLSDGQHLEIDLCPTNSVRVPHKL